MSLESKLTSFTSGAECGLQNTCPVHSPGMPWHLDWLGSHCGLCIPFMGGDKGPSVSDCLCIQVYETSQASRVELGVRGCGSGRGTYLQAPSSLFCAQRAQEAWSSSSCDLGSDLVLLLSGRGHMGPYCAGALCPLTHTPTGVWLEASEHPELLLL